MTNDPTDNPPDLNAVQRWFQAVITHPAGVDSGVESDDAQRVIRMKRDELEQIVTRSEKLTAAERLGVYANAYYARLLECLGESFPMLRRAIGRDAFDGFAFEYLQHHPSQSYTLDRLADAFPRFLAETRPDLDDAGRAPDEPGFADFLIELATLELTIAEVFDGPGVEGRAVLDAAAVRAIPTERWPDARLITSPCLRLLRFRHLVNAWYTDARAACDDGRGDDHDAADATPEPPTVADEYVAIARRDYVVRRLTLIAPQHALLDTLQRGGTVGDAIAAAVDATDMPDSDLAKSLQHWFAEWAEAQLFERVELD
ncbi:MAG: hypothetical protein GC159_02915 [Phycisphaera sp.]|nr:hypothetical protein [Phycisphaera sp.]